MKRNQSQDNLNRMRSLAGILTEATGQIVREPVKSQYLQYFFIQNGEDGQLKGVSRISYQDAVTYMASYDFTDKGNNVYDSEGGAIVVASSEQAARQAVKSVFGDFAEEMGDAEGDAAGSVYFKIEGDDQQVTATRYGAEAFFEEMKKYNAEELDNGYVFEDSEANVVFVFGMNMQNAKENLADIFGDWVETPGMPF